MPNGTKIQTINLSDHVTLDMVVILGGSLIFQSGRNVAIKSFQLGMTPVTVDQYMIFVEEVGDHYPEWILPNSEFNIKTGTNLYYKQLGTSLENPNCPILGVNWFNALSFCNWLSTKKGRSFRLPSESEWEFAAQGGQNYRGLRFSGSNKLKEVGWFRKNSHASTKPVALKLPNECGIYDMSGNIMEWCADHWFDDYESVPPEGLAFQAKTEENLRVRRGGSWEFPEHCCLGSYRSKGIAYESNFSTGFRIAHS